jgi:tetratricopeptide (TPR) repeat protein
MKPNLATSLIMLSLVIAFTGCGAKKEDKPAEVTIQANDGMKAEDLAESGEALVSPYTFMLADRVFTMALAKDPDNKKAKFYQTFIKRMMVLKGIVSRIAPLVRAGTPEQQADYERWKKEFPESPLRAFLMDGPEDLTKNAQIVDVLSDYQNALNDFRKFLKANPDLELTLNLNPHVFEKEISSTLANSCKWERNPGWEQNPDRLRGPITVVCDYSAAAQKKINAADVVAIRQITGGEMYLMSLYTAYDISTILEISQNQQLKKMTPPEVLSYYKSLPSIAKIRKEQTLSLIPELGSDFSAAVKWAKQYQYRICPKGESSRNQRPGFLFKDGLCVNPNSKDEANLVRLDQALAGIFSAPILNADEEQVDEIRTNIVGFFANPPKDLKDLLPESVDAKGRVTQWADKTFGGLFPDGDIGRIRQN